ncbi:MAG: amino-acid N-acetyltransferase [Pseudomonadales bacterium]|nr:amino-acid N-acetyltransferase [Pseudomonadales bacterium]NIX07086.1 amino-acid N-acetyltransferase [Pseudomonadales bacterium]
MSDTSGEDGEESGYARWFRASTPYISAHRDRTFVILLGGDALADGNLPNIVHDLALLHVLGARVVVVHGARPQIDAALGDSSYHEHRRITQASAMETILGVLGQQRGRLEALFSTGLPTSPLRNTDISVVGGNFVTARPVGVHGGVDHLLTGQTRRIHAGRIRKALDSGALVLLSPVGYSPSGQAFNLAADELAAEVAMALEADKLIAFGRDRYVRDENGEPQPNLTPSRLDSLIDVPGLDDATTRGHLRALLRACRGGVPRCHLVSYAHDGALLEELFTAAGGGTQISEDHSNLVRPARQEDVAGIVELIRPMEEAGALVRRPRDRLEQEIDRFFVAEVDGIVMGCCALYPFDGCAELACVAVHEAHRRKPGEPGLGVAMLRAAEAAAKALGLSQIFVLTTQTRDWFMENGFEDSTLDALPAPKQAMYNYQRNAKVMTKRLS